MPLVKGDDVFGCAACLRFDECKRKEAAQRYAETLWKHLEPAFNTPFSEIFGQQLSDADINDAIDGFYVSRTFTCENKITADGLKTEGYHGLQR